MVYRLFHLGKKLGAIIVSLFLINTLDCDATEYVFTAPPEVDRKMQEIPESESEYPLYECDNESATAENDVLDVHDCTCNDCEELTEESEPELEYTPTTDDN